MKVIKNPMLGTWEMAESEARPRPSPTHLKHCDTSRLLIVDDEQMVRVLFEDTLRKEFPGLIFEPAPDGSRAVEAFKRYRHHIILMDVVMPIMDGEEAYFEIMRYCREEGIKPPCVIFCTGFSPNQTVRNEVADNPAHCLLRKPVRRKVLLDAVRKRIGK